jgi:hypothetical protein
LIIRTRRGISEISKEKLAVTCLEPLDADELAEDEDGVVGTVEGERVGKSMESITILA